jgi:hypothetical protein
MTEPDLQICRIRLSDKHHAFAHGGASQQKRAAQKGPLSGARLMPSAEGM